MNKSSFFIAGQHAVIEALRNPNRKVLRVFLTEDAKKNIHRKNPRKNILEDVKVYFKSKKELDKYTSKEQLMHSGYVAEIEHLDQPDLKEFIKGKLNEWFRTYIQAQIGGRNWSIWQKRDYWEKVMDQNVFGREKYVFNICMPLHNPRIG